MHNMASEQKRQFVRSNEHYRSCIHPPISLVQIRVESGRKIRYRQPRLTGLVASLSFEKTYPAVCKRDDSPPKIS